MPNPNKSYSSSYSPEQFPLMPFNPAAGDVPSAFSDPIEYARKSLEEESFESPELPISEGGSGKPSFGDGFGPSYASPEMEDAPPLVPDPSLPIPEEVDEADPSRDVKMPTDSEEPRLVVNFPPIAPETRLDVRPDSTPGDEPILPTGMVGDSPSGLWIGGPSGIPDDPFPDMVSLAEEVGNQVRPDLEDMRQSIVYTAKEAIARESLYQRFGEI